MGCIHVRVVVNILVWIEMFVFYGFSLFGLMVFVMVIILGVLRLIAKIWSLEFMVELGTIDLLSISLVSMISDCCLLKIGFLHNKKGK